MADRVVCIVQARQGSSRLPGKSLRALNRRPLIAHVVERVRAFNPDVVVATTNDPRDDALARVVMELRLGVPVVRGDEHDVLDRVRTAAGIARADVIVRVTGDCPLWAPDVAESALALYRAGGIDYVWNDTAASGFPDGTDVEVFSREALEEAWKATRTAAGVPGDREHVTPWIRRHRIMDTIYCGYDYSRLKLSVDRPEDFDRVQQITVRLPPGAFLLKDTIQAAYDAGVV